MLSITIAAFLTLGLVFAAAAPSPLKQGFRVNLVVKNAGYIRSGPSVVARTYSKYGKTVPAHVVAAASASNGTVAATPQQFDQEYLAPVGIGGQTLNLDLDSGSADLWVYSSELSLEDQAGHTIYKPAQSSTSKLLAGFSWGIQYGDGSYAQGDVYTDLVAIGHTAVKSQAIEAARYVSGSFLNDINSDGLLGLSFSSVNTVSPTPQKTFFDNAIAQGLPQPVFTVDLKKGAVGSYDFGYIDKAKYTGSITYLNINPAQGFWEFTSNGFAVGKGSFTSMSIDSIADTGTTIMYLPAKVVTAYYHSVDGATYDSSQGGYVFPCSASLPSLTIGLAMYRAVVPGNYIKYAPTDTSGRTCFGGVQSNEGIGFSIFGDIFLKSQFVVFKATATPSIGFASKKL